MEKIKEMIKRGERGERMRRFIIDAYYYELIEKHERDELLQLLDNAPKHDDILVGAIQQSNEAASCVGDCQTCPWALWNVPHWTEEKRVVGCNHPERRTKNGT